jgi:sugar phosphate isomerase/epimerase
MPTLAIESITLTDTLPKDQILCAAKAGFEMVSLWTVPPTFYPKQLMTPAMERECAALLADNGIKVHSIEMIDLLSAEAVLAARPAMELGARMGGEMLVTVHVGNPDHAEAVDVLGLLAQEAAQFGLRIVFEPLCMGRTRTLGEARDLLADAGVEGGILFDTFHFVRLGETLADLAVIDPSLIWCVQVNDGVAGTPADQWLAEALHERLYPGEGDFPLVEVLRAVPRDVPWAIETPSVRRAKAGVSPEAQAKEAFAAMRRLVAQVEAAEERGA